MTDIAVELPALLAGLDPAGSFCASGLRICPPPQLEVDGVGALAFPVPPALVDALIAGAEAAPYGRGADTLVDANVRRTWQRPPEQLHLETDEVWRSTLDAIVRDAATALGVDGAVSAQLYKLLIYEAGCFFAPHRDSEKLDGMFATLVIALPSVHTGGALNVRHAGRAARVLLDNAKSNRLAWAAFYADCDHDVEAVESGARLCLVYNLVSGGQRLVPPDQRSGQAAVEAALQRWSAGSNEPHKVLAILEHHYTTAGLSLATLKGNDRSVARVLFAAAAATECRAFLAMVSTTEEGGAEEVQPRRWGRRSSWSSSPSLSANSRKDAHGTEFEIIEVTRVVRRVSGWRDASDARVDMGDIDFDDVEVSPEGALDDLAPDEVLFTEATGNEGGSFEQTYRRAAIVLWPATRDAAVAAQGGAGGAIDQCGRLDDVAARALVNTLVDRWTAAVRNHETELLTDAIDDRLLWRLLGQAVRLDDVGAAVRILNLGVLVPALAGWGDDTSFVSLAAAWRRLSRPSLAAPIAALCAGAFRPQEVCGLAAALLATSETAADRLLVAQAVVGALPAADPLREVRVGRSTPADVAGVLQVVVRAGDAALVATVAKRMLQQPPVYLDDVVAGAAAMLAVDLVSDVSGEHGARSREMVAALAAGIVPRLRERVATPLVEPSTMARPFTIACLCEHCRSLAKFLSAPDEARWALKAKENIRGHVESNARGADVDFSVERRGSPYSLVAEKNRNSFDTRKARRDADLAALRQLEAAVG